MVLFLWGALSDERTGVFCICCWPLPAQSFSGPNPMRLATIFYCLRFDPSHFVASYDSQGHGGGIRHNTPRCYCFIFAWSAKQGTLTRTVQISAVTKTNFRCAGNICLRCCENNVQQPTVPDDRPGYVYQQSVTYAMDSHVTLISSHLYQVSSFQVTQIKCY
jgi:hypothetical protein